MNKLEQISRTFIYLLILLPLIVSPSSKSPFELSKTFIFFFIISIITFVILLRKKDIELPNILIITFFVSQLISTTLSFKQGESFFGYYPRYTDGDLINLGLFLTLFCMKNLIPKVDIPKLFLVSSLPISVFLIYESFLNSDRLFATFGQPNFLSLFLTLNFIYILENFKKINLNNYLKISYEFILLFFIVKTASLTSFIILIFWFVWFLKRNLKEIITYLNDKSFILIILIFPLFLYIFSNSILITKFYDIQNQFKEGRPTYISDSLLIRFALWETSLKLITSDFKVFFLGHGQNTFIYFFEKNRNPDLNFLSEKHLFFDKPHNYYIEILFSSGIFSLALFLYLIYKSLNKNNILNSALIVIICTFIFFNWLDIYFKVILFLLIAQNLENYKTSINLKPILGILSLLVMVVSVIFLTSDYKNFKGNYREAYSINPINQEYASLTLLSNNKNHKYFDRFDNPVLNILWLQNINQENKTLLIDFLERNYAENFAIKYYIDIAK